MPKILDNGSGYTIYLDDNGELCISMNSLLHDIMTGGDTPMLVREKKVSEEQEREQED
jgi:hypothetical protein